MEININLEKLKSLAQKLPDSPGVYLMKNEAGRIIYIGKARSLKKRVRSYYIGLKDVKTRHLRDKTADIETFVTQNEGEALLLENNLIKRWKPRYNINLKDGKTYPVIKLTGEEYPRVYRTRRIVFDGSKYYGPFAKANQIDLYLNLIDRTFPLKKCKANLKSKRQPCFYHHIGRCTAPCCSGISREEYMALVEKVRLLLSGKTEEAVKELKAKMNEASRAHEYEQAGKYRDQIKAIEELSEEQKVVDFQDEARDYLGFWTEDTLACITILQMRGGKLIGRDLFTLEDYSPAEETLLNFLAQYYTGKNSLPQILYLPQGIYSNRVYNRCIDVDLLKDFLHTLSEKNIQIKFPRKGRHAQILRMAVENSKEKMASGEQKYRLALKELQESLGLKSSPKRIEGLDIAHLSGQETVAAMVTFDNGRPHKSDYRRYRIKTLKGKIDDFEAIREVVARRYTRLLNENRRKPDLILIDGGKGQVNSAVSILRILGIPHIPVIGLAKKQEEIYIPDAKKPFRFPESSAALRILQAVRDEAHRFATTFHKKLRDRKVKSSILEQVDGIGKKRSKRLLEQFGSIQEIYRKKPEEIAKVTGLSRDQAANLLIRLEQLLPELLIPGALPTAHHSVVEKELQN